MTYFVTGATGFIGRHLVERLLDRDGVIHVLVREGSQPRLEELVACAGTQLDAAAVAAALEVLRPGPVARCHNPALVSPAFTAVPS